MSNFDAQFDSIKKDYYCKANNTHKSLVTAVPMLINWPAPNNKHSDEENGNSQNDCLYYPQSAPFVVEDLILLA